MIHFFIESRQNSIHKRDLLCTGIIGVGEVIIFSDSNFLTLRIEE